MKICIIEPCGFTRLGIFSYLIENNSLDIIDTVNISHSLNLIPEFQPDIILVNMTNHCHNAEVSEELKAFLNFVKAPEYTATLTPVTRIPKHRLPLPAKSLFSTSRHSPPSCSRLQQIPKHLCR